MRIIYYTSDYQEPLSIVNGTFLCDWIQTLPDNMSHNNCWNWKLVGNQLVFSVEQSVLTPLSLLASNRTEALILLNKKVSELRESLLPVCQGGLLAIELQTDPSFIASLASAAGITVDEYTSIITTQTNKLNNLIKATEINRIYYRTQIKAGKIS
jgi:hypothetical protein